MRGMIMLCLLAACGTDQFTWGDASTDLAVAYCDRMEVCGYVDKTTIHGCVAHTEFHFCELEDTCGVSLPEVAEAETDACVAAMVDVDCFFLANYGAAPTACEAIFARRPGG